MRPAGHTFEMIALAPEVPLAKRQQTLQALLGRMQSNGTRTGAPVARAPSAPAAPAQEKITAFDDRWGGPPAKPAAALAAAPVPAKPVAAPSGDRAKRLQTLLDRILANRRS